MTLTALTPKTTRLLGTGGLLVVAWLPVPDIGVATLATKTLDAIQWALGKWLIIVAATVA